MNEEFVAEYKPSYWRMLWRPLLYAVGLGFLISFIVDTSHEWRWYDFLFYSLLFAIIALFSTPDPQSVAISVSTWRITGPSALKGKRIDIALEDIEIVLSRHVQGGSDSLYNRHWIYSSGAKKILLLCDGFPKGTFEQILDTIVRLRQEKAATQQNIQS